MHSSVVLELLGFGVFVSTRTIQGRRYSTLANVTSSCCHERAREAGGVGPPALRTAPMEFFRFRLERRHLNAYK